MKATKSQKQYIYKLCRFDKDDKAEMVQWATGDPTKTSTNDLSFDQANMVITELGGMPEGANTWARFDKHNRAHRNILSLAIQYGWSTENPRNGQTIADLDKLGRWLMSPKAPVKVPLQDQAPRELSRTISALENMITKKYR